MRASFATTFFREASIDKSLALLMADISPAVPSLSDFQHNYPDRCINIGVSEQIMIGMAAGMAMRGLKPFAYTIATFSLYRPFEFIRVDLAYQNLPVTVVGAAAGVVYSNLGSTHQAIEDIAVASAIPGMTVMAPCDPLETEEVTRWCARQNMGPVYLRIGKTNEMTFTDKAVDPFVQGKLRYICRGSDICIICYGSIIRLAFELKDTQLCNSSVSIVSCHTIKPLDEEGLKEIFSCHREVVVIEEHVPHGGLGSRVKAFAWDHKIDRELSCYSLKDEFIHFFGSHDELLEEYHLSVEHILI